ncbi:hypothetical protein LC048_17185 [Mesobacillus subterraneus]|uniref:hypothetical protein n=1 Tax=Mesobacillus subterraneus TaxID=285983 RepID=UPI001CFE9C3D|nr:hypothetical protein [Mesobacillus subterraneus]WLR54175.1 hypothetical protein LC048_17185 [Mesobacillus subterraneus]
MNELGLILVLVLALWSITKTLEKLAKRIIDKQEQQYELLKEIKELLKSEK